MSIIKTIYNIKPNRIIANQEAGLVMVELPYNGQLYVGYASLHPEEEDFFSYKVGRAIATSRARIEIFKHELAQARDMKDKKYQFYQEAINYGHKSPAEVDPTGAFHRNVTRAFTRVARLEEALKKERRNLNEYLAGQDKAIASIKRQRAKRAAAEEDKNS